MILTTLENSNYAFCVFETKDTLKTKILKCLKSPRTIKATSIFDASTGNSK